MEAKKQHIIVRFMILLLLAVAILISCKEINMYPTKSLLEFSELIEQGKFNEINLTIYYMSPFTSTRIPLNVDDLINTCEEQKIVISGNRFEEHIDLFKQIGNDDLIRVKKKSYLNARIYYVFETEKEGKILDVAMWGGENNSIFVNGFEVKGNDIFYDIIKPFLPEDAVKELENYVVGIRAE